MSRSPVKRRTAAGRAVCAQTPRLAFFFANIPRLASTALAAERSAAILSRRGCRSVNRALTIGWVRYRRLKLMLVGTQPVPTRGRVRVLYDQREASNFALDLGHNGCLLRPSQARSLKSRRLNVSSPPQHSTPTLLTARFPPCPVSRSRLAARRSINLSRF